MAESPFASSTREPSSPVREKPQSDSDQLHPNGEKSSPSTAEPSPTPTIGSDDQVTRPSPHHTRHSSTDERSELKRGEVPEDLVGPRKDDTAAYKVVFSGDDDPRNAQNWPFRKKVMQTALITMATMWSGMASAVVSGAAESLGEHFHVGSVVAELANSMFVFGFALGPLVFGPLSEVLGRKWPLTIGIFLGTIFSIQTAAAHNLATVMIGRFLGGVFGAAPYAIGGGWFHDVYHPLYVQCGIAFFAVATAGGPALGPVAGAGFASLGVSGGYAWRWGEWFIAAFGLIVAFLLLVFMDEGYGPTILGTEAKRLRRETGVWAYHAEVDLVSLTLEDICTRYIVRPIRMLFTEPILAVTTVYMSFVYSLIYILMAALPIIYGEYRGMSVVVSSLPFISAFVGTVAGGALVMVDKYRYTAVLERKGKLEEGIPEQRFIPMGLGAVLLPVGLFWFAFTGPAQTSSPWPSIIALAVAQCGIILIYECGIIYMIDIYRSFTNSAIAANTLVRSFLGGGFPLFTGAMVRNLGYKGTWAMALLAFISLAMAPTPFVFYHIGAKLRAKSSFSYTL
ncbi:hypothetical protein VHUM_02049 [Vanrija humicola]|uniref:Major facilitator superfamily (MFS) profile domain-containing protein n=1 Tax=Vanrija humicola TaxID=5417 RepID=A0A7D8ZP39_VANHU|nr:hypothetical protein VHUM_02049 [Vanrija humicola]